MREGSGVIPMIHVRRVVPLLLVVAFLCGCGSSTSTSVSAKAPRAPGNVELNVTSQGLHLRWDPIQGASHYTVFWGFRREDYKQFMDFKENSALLVGLKKGRLYSLAVTAWNQRGESDYSEERLVVYDDDPRHAGDYVGKGNELVEKGQYVEAHPYFSAAIRLDPHNAHAYQSRAILYEKMNRFDLAKRDYAAAQNILKTRPLTQKGVRLSEDTTVRQD
jgi:tetratricopeptide (TPR) repeat protein